MVLVMGGLANLFADDGIDLSVVEGMVAGENAFVDVGHVIISGIERLGRGLALDSEMNTVARTRPGGTVRRLGTPKPRVVVIVLAANTMIQTAGTTAGLGASDITKGIDRVDAGWYLVIGVCKTNVNSFLAAIENSEKAIGGFRR